MINVSTYTKALYTKLVALAALSAVTMERGERINFDPGRCPWLGVYPGTVSSTPKTLGAGNNRWASQLELMIVIQTSSFEDDGQAASDSLEGYIEAALQGIDADLTLGVAGCRILRTSREYRYVVMDEDGNGTVFMPQAIIKLQMEARSA